MPSTTVPSRAAVLRQRGVWVNFMKRNEQGDGNTKLTGTVGEESNQLKAEIGADSPDSYGDEAGAGERDANET